MTGGADGGVSASFAPACGGESILAAFLGEAAPAPACGDGLAGLGILPVEMLMADAVIA